MFLPRARALLRSAAQAAAATKAAAQPSRITIGYTPGPDHHPGGAPAAPPAPGRRRADPAPGLERARAAPARSPGGRRGHPAAAGDRRPARDDPLRRAAAAHGPASTTGWRARSRSPSTTSPASRSRGCPTRRGTPTGASTRARTARPAPDGPLVAALEDKNELIASGQAVAIVPAACTAQPPPRPHHDPAARRGAQPCDPGHPVRRPQPPRRGFPQVSAGLPDGTRRGNAA